MSLEPESTESLSAERSARPTGRKRRGSGSVRGREDRSAQLPRRKPLSKRRRAERKTTEPQDVNAPAPKALVKRISLLTLDRRTALGKAVQHWRAALLRDLSGGMPLSAQRTAIVDIAVRSKLIIDSIDHWLLSQRSIVDKRRRTLIAALKERQQLVDSFVRCLQAVGLEQRTHPFERFRQEFADVIKRISPSARQEFESVLVALGKIAKDEASARKG
jgi:hypothetical protein